MAPHRFEIRVYYEDTDFSGNVYHAAYLKFMERARTEFLRAQGIHHSELARDGLAFAVRSMHIEFQQAARIDDLLTVTTEVTALTGARLGLRQMVLRGEVRLVTADVVIAAITTVGRPTRLPAALRERFGPASITVRGSESVS